MFIRLKINQEVDCAYVEAWSRKPGEQTADTLRFMHTNFWPSLRELNKPSRNCESDAFITFKSDISLSTWRSLVENSEFNDAKKYHLLKNNCAQAAAFALEQAGIKLFQQQSYYILMNRLHNTEILRFPVYTLSPWDIYSIAKRHKIQSLNNSDIEMQYRFTQLKIKFWTELSAAPVEEKKYVSTIVEEIEKRHHQYPQHIEDQIDVLMLTYKFVTQIPTQKVYDTYMQKATQFESKAFTTSEIMLPWLRTLVWGIHLGGSGLFGGALVQGNKHLMLACAGIVSLSTFTIFKFQNTLFEHVTNNKTQGTGLSETMVKLARSR